MKCVLAAGFAIGFSLLLTGCSETPMPVVHAAVITPADEAAIRDAEAAWARDCKSGDLNRIVSHYTDDASVTFPDWVFPVQGKANIRTELKDFLSAGNLSVSFTSSGQNPPSPVRWGTYSLTWTNPETKVWTPEKGPYLTVFRKLANGSWAVAEQKYFGRHLRYQAPDGNYLRPLKLRDRSLAVAALYRF